ncbi:hypothetical protein ACHAW5_008349 [Stephanodiscus triporus]|uniref:HEAT repeat-containing protein 1 n=1 Tax=Stephanodiscus triporus TaxID=2934178 RepID=A0ABD3NQZ6_9STRA
MSSVAFGCFQSLANNLQEQRDKDRSSVLKAVSDIRLCECGSILLEGLGCEGRRSFFDFCDTTNDDEIMQCKATLFSCLGKILAMSTMNACASHSKHKNNRERRGPLFPWGAEKTVNMIVKTTLPFLEVLIKGDGTAVFSSEKVNYGYWAMECLYFLFQDPRDPPYESIASDHPFQLSKHAAATFAPLIVDVLPDGKENQHVNPLRSRTLSTIFSFWELSYELMQKGKKTLDETEDQTMVVVMSCQCLAAALSALSALRKSKTEIKQDVPNEIDVSTTARQLQSMIQNEELQHLRPKFLSLLALLGLAFPSASASQWHLFLEHSAAKKSLLLGIMEEGAAALDIENFHDENWISLPSALHAISVLLTAMSVTLWISGDARPSTRTSGGNFSSRVRSALINVMNCLFKLMSAIKGRICCERASSENLSFCAPTLEIVMMLASEVAGKLCTKLPYNGENDILLRSSSSIVQCAGDIYVQSLKSFVSKSLATKAEMKQTLLDKAVATFSHVILESLGAGLSSSNAVEATTCSAPAKHLLSDTSSFEFIGLLLTDSCWPCPSSRERMEMLSAVAKSSPWTLVREPFNLASFCNVCVAQSQSRNANSRILGLKVIESFIVGRKTCLDECTPKSTVFSVIPHTFCPLLLVALEDHSAAVRTSAVISLGSLIRHDWIRLFLSDITHVNASSINWTPLKSILSLCTANVEKIASVRSSSCKAIGDISASCIHHTLCETGDDMNCEGTLSDEFAISFAGKVCEVMVIALSDHVAIVRSMALFAIGNIALALKKEYMENSSPTFPMKKSLFLSVCGCIDDDDEKVVANAIRSISHVSYFVYHPQCSKDIETSDSSSVIDVFKNLVTKLIAKINFALDDAVGDSPRGLTWKQRNGAKKQSWGSCATLGTMLSFSNILPHLDYTLLESALSSLFRCIQLSNLINDKISAAAINALLGLPIALWEYLSCECDCIGRGLATFFGYIEERNTTTACHRRDVESLANSLLVRARAADFRRLFLIRDSVPFSVEFFYRWLVARDVETGILEEIAAAVSGSEVAEILDVSLAQMFLSRAVQRNQRHGPPREGFDRIALAPPDEGDDEGDEL